MSRAIPILTLYKEAIKDSGAQLVLQCANNYPFILGGGSGIEGMFSFNRAVRQKTAACRSDYGLGKGEGLKVVEVSDDFLLPYQLVEAKKITAKGVLSKSVEADAKNSDVFYIAMGTGATFSYAHVKGEDTAFFDRTESGQKLWLNSYFDGWAMHAKALGIELYTGRRPGVLRDKASFESTIRLKDMPDFIKSMSIIDLGKVSYGSLDPYTEITKSEAMNLALALEMNRHVPGVMQAVEQMQYAGMEPNTVEQTRRFNEFMKVNLPWGFFLDMADNGHVGVRGSRTSNNPDDYDLFAYSDSYQGPLLFIHHNILYENRKQPGTRQNLEKDRLALNRVLVPKDMPFPERIRNINDYLLRCLDNPSVSLTVVSPEPTCGIDTDQDQLASDVAEATCLTALRILETGKYEELESLPFAFVTKGHKERLDNRVRGMLSI